MDAETKLDGLLLYARAALATLDTDDPSVAGLVDRLAAIRYAEGTLVGFLEALVLMDPSTARWVTPRIKTFISEAIAARLLLT